VASSYLAFVTPDIKALLLRKNRLMRKGRTEEAGALAIRIGKIRYRNSIRLRKVTRKNSSKEFWAKVRQITNNSTVAAEILADITADTLNQHYASISSDQIL